MARCGWAWEACRFAASISTDAQREQVRGIMTARQADFKAIGDRLKTAHEAQRQAVTRVPVDENEIRARVSEASAVEADFAILRARIHEQVYQVLTPEQQAKAKTLEAERQKRRAERAEQFKQQRQAAAVAMKCRVLKCRVPKC